MPPGAILLTPRRQKHGERKANDQRTNGKADGHPGGAC
ncbi:hypothetical protein [Citrobacter freundii]|uniref:Uncharacterized protein n=1 Tax=Citrobacter freundii TaxID=546 RepID=A0A7G2IJ97_CITFR|nr:hypothetical protein [Citrobacter freundii]